MSWKRVSHPSQVLAVGDTVKVQIIKINPDTQRISLGMKQLQSDPWDGVDAKYPVGARFTGRITNITDYGAFVELEAGVEGLVHVSEMSWTKKNAHPGKIVSTSQEVDVVVLDVDASKRRISLGLKQAQQNPWEQFVEAHPIGSSVEGEVKNTTEFGLFIGLDNDIDGMVHLSDIDWNTPGEEAMARYKKGDMVKARVLDVDVEKERISLGIKQLSGDPFNNFISANDKGSLVTGTIKTVDPKGAVVQLADDVEGYLRASEISADRVEDARNVLKEGEQITALVVNVDRKSRNINLSIKAKDSAEQQEAMQKFQADTGTAGTTNLGALLKAKLGQDNQ